MRNRFMPPISRGQFRAVSLAILFAASVIAMPLAFTGFGNSGTAAAQSSGDVIDYVFVSDGNGNIYKIDRETGEQITWDYSGSIGSTEVSKYHDGYLYVGDNSVDGGLHKINPGTGEADWVYSGNPSRAFAFDDSHVYSADNDNNNLTKIKTETGEAEWNVSLQSGEIRATTHHEGSVYIANSDDVVELDAETGDEIDRLTLTEPATGLVTGSDGNLYASNTNGAGVTKIDTGSLEVVWNELSVSANTIQSNGNGTIYIGSNSDEITAIDHSGNSELVSATPGSVYTVNVGVDGGIYAGGYDSWSGKYNSSSGSNEWDFATSTDVQSIATPVPQTKQIIGTVEDQTGSLVPNATVEVRREFDNALIEETTTNQNGQYTIDTISTDDETQTYNVEVSVGGEVRWDNNWELPNNEGYNITIEMRDPEITNASPSGSSSIGSNADGANLSVDVTDDDFPSDEVSVEFYEYIDGTEANDVLIGSDTVASSENGGTVTASTTWNNVSDLGAYDWYAVASDQYNSTNDTISEVQTFEVSTSAPVIDGGSADPHDEIVDSETVDLSVDVDDHDFPEDNVTVRLLEYSSGDPDADDLIHEETLDSNGTVSTTWYKDANQRQWYVYAEDSYGHSSTSAVYSFDVAGEIAIRDAETGDRITDRNVSVEVTSTGENLEEIVSSGRFDLSQLSQWEDTRRIEIQAKDYYSRTIEIRSITSDQDVYLERGPNWESDPTNDDPTDSPDPEQDDSKVTVRFTVSDRTSEFPPEETVLRVNGTVAVNGSTNETVNGTTNQTQAEIHSERFGTVNRVDVIMNKDERYRLTVENDDGQMRGLGGFTATQSETVELMIGEIRIVQPEDGGAAFNARMANEDEYGKNKVRVTYVDDANQTDRLTYYVHAAGNDKDVINEIVTVEDVSEYSAVLDIPESENQTLEVTWKAQRAGEEIGGTVPVGTVGQLNPPVSDLLLHSLGFSGIILLGGLFGGRMSRTGAVVIVVAAWAMRILGLVAIPYPLLVTAGIVAIMFKVGDSGYPS
ncbi:outer membrane protein assembly factor BamB family protein [Natrinema ejinorense]|uniref:Pyrrolo-quinoline quinone repeat domain-containing protein n=1 Tax=Natrinema ejinorense TaxID=373386 RepID=A0A2A5QRK6_9EURY|nr:PQQ-binding-like beta-propeller repeat protein [Natrinema ejinorense]PCR89434.1 hypothetical protein CP557_02110 [Natrinema ejinorense]